MLSEIKSIIAMVVAIIVNLHIDTTLRGVIVIIVYVDFMLEGASLDPAQ